MPATLRAWLAATAWLVEFQRTLVLAALTCNTLPRLMLALPEASKMTPLPDLTTKATAALLTPALKSPAVIQALAEAV